MQTDVEQDLGRVMAGLVGSMTVKAIGPWLKSRERATRHLLGRIMAGCARTRPVGRMIQPMLVLS